MLLCAAIARTQTNGYSSTSPSLEKLQILGKREPIAPDAEAAEDLSKRRPDRFWMRGEFLLGWITSAKFPPLVTTGPSNEARPGALDSGNTSVLFGSGGMDFQDRNGARFTLGLWLDAAQTLGVEANYFFLAGRSIEQAFTSPGEPVLATPFFNVNKGIQDSSLITYPGLMNGQISIRAPSFLQGIETNAIGSLWNNERLQFEGLLGVRYLNLQEGLHINSTTLVELAPQYQGLGIPFENNTIIVRDRFDAHTHFIGAQVGARGEWTRRRFGIELTGKVALGVAHEVVEIRGFTGIDTQPATARNAGLFALSSNSGRHTRNEFAVAPEGTMRVKFRVTERLHLFGGYWFLYMSRVARPGDQIDPGVNLNLVPTSNTFGTAGGANRPGVNIRSTDFFVHGATFGLEWRY